MTAINFKLENIEIFPENFSKNFQKIIGKFDFLDKNKKKYLASCGCNKNSECNCVDYFGCEGYNCSCHYYDPDEDNCARYDCSTMCNHGIWGI